jgi:hypothetical protein
MACVGDRDRGGIAQLPWAPARQAMEARLAGARALARQWFGAWLRPRAPADEWLLEGLAGYLEDVYVRRFMGRNELLYRCGPRGAPRRARGPLPWARGEADAAKPRSVRIPYTLYPNHWGRPGARQAR